MGPRSPSEFLEFLTATGGNIFTRNSFLKILYERLPPHISILIDSEINSQNETSVVQKADKIFLTFSRDKNRGRSREKNSKNHKSNSRDRFSSRDRYYRSPRRF